MPTGIESLVFAALASNSLTFSLAGSALAIQSISAAVTSGLFLGAQLALAPRNRGETARPDLARRTVKIADAPLLVCVGRARVAGSVLFENAIRQSGSNNLHVHNALCAGPIDGFEDFYLSNRVVVVGAGGEVISPPYAWFVEDGVLYYARLFPKAGADTEAVYAPLADAFPDIVGEDHRGDGLAQLYGIFSAPGDSSVYLKTFSNGKPGMSADLRGMLLYDPRTDTTAWSDNGVLAVLWYLTAPAALGWGLPLSQFDMDDIAGQADLAEETVALREGGTEPRSRAWGVYGCDRPRGETLADLLLSTDTRIVRLQNGKFSIRLEDDDPDPELTISIHDIEEFDWASGPESFEKPNRMTVKYFPQSQDYSVTELVTSGLRWGTDTTEIARVGERKAELTLNFCPSHGQASRIARRVWHARRAARGRVRTGLAGMGALGRTVAEIPRVGTTGTIRVTMQQPELEKERTHVSIPFVEAPTLPEWTPSLDQALPPDPLPSSAYSGNVATPDAPGAATQVQYPDASHELRARIPAPGEGLTAFAVYTQYVGAARQPLAQMTVAGTLAYVADNETGNRVDFQVAQYDANGELSAFSAPLTVDPVTIDNTAPGAPDVEDEPHLAMSIVDGVELAVAAPELNVVKLVAEYNFNDEGWTVHTTLNDVRPGVARLIVMDGFLNETVSDLTLQWRVRSFTSNDTPGSYASGSVLIPGNPP